jgi:hypothetical protein
LYCSEEADDLLILQRCFDTIKQLSAVSIPLFDIRAEDLNNAEERMMQ